MFYTVCISVVTAEEFRYISQLEAEDPSETGSCI